MGSIVQEKFEKNKVNIVNGNEFEYSLSVVRYLLKMIAAWPLDENASTFERFFKRVVNVLCYLSLLSFFVPTVLYVIFISQNIRTNVKICAMIFTCFTNGIKYILLLKHSNEIKACLYQTKEDWENVTLQQDYKNMLSRSKLGRDLAILSTCLIYGSNLFNRVIMPIIKGNIIVKNVTIRPLACPSYYIIFDEQKSPVYELVFLSHFLSGFVAYSIASAVFALTTYFITHACGQLEILIRKMKEIETANSDIENADKFIHQTILQQTKIRSFVKKVAEIVQYMCLAEIATCMSSICGILYALALDYNSTISIITYTVIIVTFTYNLFIFCYIGELLADQNMKVMATSRTLDWHNLLVKSARNLILIILVSNDPPKLVAGKILDLTLSNFTSMFKTTIGYFNILRSTTL